jgi:hypothetical protein
VGGISVSSALNNKFLWNLAAIAAEKTLQNFFEDESGKHSFQPNFKIFLKEPAKL